MVLATVRRDEEGIASGTTNALRELGGVFGVAVLAAVFSHNGGYATGQAFVDGLRPAVLVGAGGVTLAALALVFVPRRSPAAQPLEADRVEAVPVAA
jgi:hypothetical protein